MYCTCQQVWQGASVVVAGGGPSFQPEQVARFRSLGYRVIGVNDAYLLGVCVDVCFWGDGPWYHGTPTHPGHKARLARWPGCKLTVAHECANEPCVQYLIRSLEPRLQVPPYLHWYGNSGLTAVGLAVVLGASRVVMLGFDGAPRADGQVNWHADNVTPPEAPAWLIYREQARQLAQDIERWPGGSGLQIFNATPNTQYDAFPTADWRELG